jgi:hypothetical protein
MNENKVPHFSGGNLEEPQHNQGKHLKLEAETKMVGSSLI